ncbi:MAG: hypothetical protein RLZZ508_152 [Actinomycetota bacterium]|jgi:type II restriction enzyme
MNLSFNKNLAEGYSSKSQIVRRLTEDWVLNNLYCPCCGGMPLNDFENNRPVADFYCKACSEEFELKSKEGRFSNTIAGGAYLAMIERISSDNSPNFFFLTYTKQWSVNDFFIIPKQFFTQDIIIKRAPLAETARRSGWVGCNIDISKVSDAGKVFVVKDSQVINQEVVKKAFNKTSFLRAKNKDAKGWLLDVMNCIDSMKTENFTLNQIYEYEENLKKKYPKNNFIKDKIRQQLQILRDRGIIEFVGRGNYRKSID